MAERWQQWMPFHIDRFRGSPDVQAMHPVARIGYLYLLASAWQTDDCSIPSDDLDLASLSGLGDDLWNQYKPRILRKFTCRSDGRLFNDVEFVEWLEAKRIFEARSAAARKTTETRSPSQKPTVTVDKPDGHRTPTARRPSRSADTITGTGTTTETTTEKQKQKPAASAACELPPWVDCEAWAAYEEMRKKKRAPMTPKARDLVLKTLAGFEAKGMSSTESLNQSVRSNWTDVYEPKSKNFTGGNTHGNTYGKPNRSDRIIDSGTRLAQKIIRDAEAEALAEREDRHSGIVDDGAGPKRLGAGGDARLLAQDALGDW